MVRSARASRNSIDRFRAVVRDECAALVGTVGPHGNTFVRRALLDAIATLSEQLQACGGAPSPSILRLVACKPDGARPAHTIVRNFVPAQRSVGMTETMQQLAVEVARALALPTEWLLSPRREARTAHARQICMYLMWHVLGVSTPAIARFFGKRDHTTVLHARNRIQRQLDAGEIAPDHFAVLTAIATSLVPPACGAPASFETSA